MNKKTFTVIKKMFIGMFFVLFTVTAQGSFKDSLAARWQSLKAAYPYSTSCVELALDMAKFNNKPLELVHNIEHASDDQILHDFYVTTHMPTQDVVAPADKLSLSELCDRITKREVVNGRYVDTTEKDSKTSIKVADAPERAAKIVNSIPENVEGTIVIYVAGFSGEHSHAPKLYPVNSVHTVHRMYEKGMLNNVYTVAYSGPHQDRKTFNYGQELDQVCLDRVYKITKQRNPNAKIVFFGISAGATIILNYLANPKFGADENGNRFANLDSIILESPAISFDDVIKSLKTSEYNWGQVPTRWTLPWLFYHYFPNYKPGKTNDDVLATYKKIPTHIKVFLGSLEHDQVANRYATARIFFELNRDGRQVTSYEYCDKEAKHGRLGGHPEYQKQVKEFLKKYGLDHQD